jgi:hypothetical protein
MRNDHLLNDGMQIQYQAPQKGVALKVTACVAVWLTPSLARL